MISGHRPFEGTSVSETTFSILNGEPPPLVDVPIEIQRIVNKALSKDRNERYRFASELLADLREVREPEGALVVEFVTDVPQTYWDDLQTLKQSGRPWQQTHRRFRFNVLIPILVATGFVAGLVYLLSYWPSSATIRERELREELEEAAAESEIKVQHQYYAVEPITVKLRDGNTVTAYDAKSMIAVITSSRTDLVEDIRAPELSALRDYVTEVYPIPQIETLERINLEQEESLDRVLVTEDAKKTTFANVFQFISRIRALVDQRRLSIDLTVISSPQDGAGFDMWASGGPHRTTTTNNVLDNVYRGLYRYKVTKGGYKVIEESLNLVDSDGRQLDCFLNQLNDQDGPRPCKLR